MSESIGDEDIFTYHIMSTLKSQGDKQPHNNGSRNVRKL